eukprot:1905725-Rhodomonas_salina.1
MNLQTRDQQQRGMEQWPLAAAHLARPALPFRPLPPPSASFVSLSCTSWVQSCDFFFAITSQGTSAFVFDNRLPPPTAPTLSEHCFMQSSLLSRVNPCSGVHGRMIKSARSSGTT